MKTFHYTRNHPVYLWKGMQVQQKLGICYRRVPSMPLQHVDFEGSDVMSFEPLPRIDSILLRFYKKSSKSWPKIGSEANLETLPIVSHSVCRRHCGRYPQRSGFLKTIWNSAKADFVGLDRFFANRDSTWTVLCQRIPPEREKFQILKILPKNVKFRGTASVYPIFGP